MRRRRLLDCCGLACRFASGGALCSQRDLGPDSAVASNVAEVRRASSSDLQKHRCVDRRNETMPPFWSASARGSALPLVEPTYIVSRQALPMRQQWRCFRFDRQRLRDNANHIAVAVAFSLTLSTSATSILLCTVVAALRFQEVRRQVMTLQRALPVLLVGLAMMGLLWADTAWSDRRAGLPGVWHRLREDQNARAQF